MDPRIGTSLARIPAAVLKATADTPFIPVISSLRTECKVLAMSFNYRQAAYQYNDNGPEDRADDVGASQTAVFNRL